MTAEGQDRSRLPLGTIPLDSIYTPVRHAPTGWTPTRVGSATDLDRLTLEVRTNGTISPHEAISDAAKILDRYLILFFDFGEQEEHGSIPTCTAPCCRARTSASRTWGSPCARSIACAR